MSSVEDVAEILARMYRYQYVCVSIQENLWYEFKDHRWRKMPAGYSLRQRLLTEMRIIYHYKFSLLDKKDQDEIKLLVEIMSKLKTVRFKNVMKKCQELFYAGTFMSKLDKNPYLVGFENGIYDLQKEELRDGRPGDYISMSIGVDYTDHDAIEISGDNFK